MLEGEFDHVSTQLLLLKLQSKGVHLSIFRLLQSWLSVRRANVIVQGSASSGFLMSDMVYQGTVLGPKLWNFFFEDVRKVINHMGFNEVLYADDLNCFRAYARHISEDTILSELNECQEQVHLWGAANQVVFDASKEDFTILDTQSDDEKIVKLLGIHFDTRLRMDYAIHECAQEASWKLRSLLRSRRFFKDAEMVLHFKSHLLSYIEYRTPAIYHATTTALAPIDRILSSFLRQLGISDIHALIHFKLAPLSSRRDVAMLGAVHLATSIFKKNRLISLLLAG